jgi:transaldolase
VIDAAVSTGRRDWKLYFQVAEGTAEKVMTEANGLDGLVAERTGSPLHGPTFVCKLLPTPDCLFAASSLVARGIEVCVTAVANPIQAMAVAGFPHVLEWHGQTPETDGPPASRNPAFPHSVACYVGRLDDAGRDGVETVAEIASLFASQGIRTRVLAASIRSNDVLARLIGRIGKGGGNVDVTLAFPLLSSLLDDPITRNARQQFERLP